LLRLDEGANVQSVDLGYDKFDRLVQTVSMLGSVLVGMGAMLAVTANWEVIPSLVKVAIVVVVTLGTYFAGWMLSKTTTHQRIGEALIFLGAIMYGVGIWLIAQINGYDLDFHLGLLLWAVGIAPIAFLSRSGIVAVLSCTVLNVWLLVEPFSYTNICFWAVLSFTLAYFVQSPWALSKALLGSVFWLVDKASFGVYEVTLVGVILCLGYHLHVTQKRLAPLSQPFLYLGTIVTLTGVLSITAGTQFHYHAPNELFVWLVRGIWVLSAVAALRFARASLPEVLGCVALTVAIFGISLVNDTVAHHGLGHALSLSAIVAFLCAAIFRVRNQMMMLMTMLVFTCQVGMLYEDSTFGLGARSLFFVLGGIALFTLATLAQTYFSRAPQTAPVSLKRRAS
jgi:uncharacterized membrane protein